MNFNTYIDTFISEKGLDLDHVFEVEGESGLNCIPLAVLVEHMKIANSNEQAQIKTMIVKIDFMNGNVMHFFNHLAQAIAV